MAGKRKRNTSTAANCKKKNAHRESNNGKPTLSKKEEARLKKESAQAKKEKEREERERQELRERANRVIDILQHLSNKKKVKDVEALSIRSDASCNDPTVASRTLFNAVECQDVDRARSTLRAMRCVVRSNNGQKVVLTPKEMDILDDNEDMLSKGWKWKIPFTCPISKENVDINALSVALANGQMDVVHLLVSYFGWMPVLQREARSLEYQITKSIYDFPQVSLDCLLAQDAFVERLPRLTLAAINNGRLPFARRALRYFLGLCTSELMQAPSQEIIRIIKKQHASSLQGLFGVTPLHVLVLEEAVTVPLLHGIDLNEQTTNAPALGFFVTPLHLAALSGNLDVYLKLQEAGGDWTILTNDSKSAIHYAAAAPSTIYLPKTTPLFKVEQYPPAKRAKKIKCTRRKIKQEEDMNVERNEEDGDPALEKFQEIVQPSATLRYMTMEENLDENLQHELTYNLRSTTRTVLETAIRANQHHNIAWLIHWFDHRDSSKYYQYNGELSVLQKVIQWSNDDADLMALFLASPKFRATFLSAGTDLVSSAVEQCRLNILQLIWTGEYYNDMEEKERVTLEGTPVHLETAIKKENLTLIRALLQKGGGNVDVNSPEVPRSALHVACGIDFVDAAKFLLEECKANPRAETSPDGVSVMQHACRSAARACIQLLLSKGISLDLEKENEIKKQEEAEERKRKEKEDENKDMEIEETSPFEGWFMVLTGIFSVSKDVIKNVVESQGGKVQAQVNGKTTHCVYSGRDGYNDYGQKMGKGDKKYTTAKKKKLPFLNENDILRYLKRAGQGIASHETSGNLSTSNGNKKGNEEASFLHDVIKNCTNKNRVLPSVSTLLEHGASIIKKDDFGRTPLHYAIMYLAESDSNIKLLKVLDPSSELVLQYDKIGFTPLLHAASLGKWKFVKVLMPRVKDVNIFVNATEKEDPKKDEKGEENDVGADTKPKFQNEFSGWSFGHILLMYQKVELFDMFLDLGGDVNTVMQTSDKTPLVVASICQPDICRTLLKNPKCKINAADAKGNTLLHAVFLGVWVGQVLSPKQESENKEKGIVKPKVMQAERPYGEVSVIHLSNILQWNHELDVHLKDIEGTSIFHAACKSEETTSCVRALLKKGSNNMLHELDGQGNSPLAISLLNRKLHVSLFLMDHGADINGYAYWRSKNDQGDNNGGELIDKGLYRMLLYQYVMKFDMSADIIYNMLRSPLCNMDVALRSSIIAGNLKWTAQLIRSVEVRSPKEAGHFVRLLFSSTSNPSVDKQEKMLELSGRLVKSAGGIFLDSDGMTGFNIIHTVIDKKINAATFSDLLQLLGKELSIQALLSTNKQGRTALHMAVIVNNLETSRMILSYIKENKEYEKLECLLGTKDKESKTALHYAVSMNSLGTYLDGAMLSLLVKYGSKITIPDSNGLTVAMVIGQMPSSTLKDFKIALTGQENKKVEDNIILSKDALYQIDQAQAERNDQLAKMSEDAISTQRDHGRKWLTLQKQWEELRMKRLKAKHMIVQETKKKAILGLLEIPVDNVCPDHHAYEVHIGGEGDVYDALLLATDLRYNVFGSNTYHSLQLVQLTESYKKERVRCAVALANEHCNEAMYAYRLGKAKYRVLEKWGRVGDWDSKSRAQGFTQLSKAIEYFERVFYDKTKNEFPQRECFKAVRGSYNFVQKQYNEIEQDGISKSDGTLPESIKTFLRAITSLTRVRNDLREDGFGVENLPLTQLSPNTISDAYKILQDIETNIVSLNQFDKLRGRALREIKSQKYKVQSKLTELSNDFYMTIPHDFGNVNTRFTKPDVIDDHSQLEKCLKLVLSLEDVESSVNLLLSVSSKDTIRNRLNNIYDLIGCSLEVVAPELDEYKLIQQYAEKGCQGDSMKIAHLLRVNRFEDTVRFAPREASRGLNNKFGQPMNQLLWHGSKMSNVLGILMKGFKIAPKEAPTSGYNFGKGIYFADVFRKSSGYSSTRYGYSYSRKKKTDVDRLRAVILCETALGEPYKIRNANTDLTEPPEGFNSVQAIGKTTPDPSGMFLTKEGVGIPLGKVESTSSSNASMSYNEFVVYDESRVRIKYVMLFE